MSAMKFSMDKYKSDVDTKAGIDRIQMKYQCCGAEDYRDWFFASWINTDYWNPTIYDV